MLCRFTFKSNNASKKSTEYAEQKITKLIERFVTKPVEVHLVFSDVARDYVIHCHLKGGDGFSSEIKAQSSNHISCIDIILNKLEKQLKRKKERLKDNHKGGGARKHNLHNKTNFEKKNWEEEPIDADDILKYEESREKRAYKQVS